MLAIQNINAKPYSVQFRGNQDKACETHSALKTRGVFGAITATAAAIGFSAIDFFSKGSVDAFSSSALKGVKKYSFITLSLMIAASLGCGALIDSMFNNNHKQLAEDMKTKTKQDILANNDSVQLTDKGNMYYHANTGKKVGTLYGALALTALNTISSCICKTPISKLMLASSVVIGGITGLVSGTISDFFANRTAKKFADRQAVINAK